MTTNCRIAFDGKGPQRAASSFFGHVQSRVPVFKWLPKYSVSLLLQDMLAGFTVGLTEIPQGIAYAIIAGLPAQYGLYSGFMGCFVYFLFGSCKDINAGPTAIMALMIQPHVHVMGPDGAVLICFLSGCIIFLFGLLRLGFLVEFFSFPITAGFTTAAALNIAASQLKNLLGIPGKSDNFLNTLIEVFRNIQKTKLWDCILGIFTAVCLIIFKEIGRYGSLKYRLDWTRTRNIVGKCVFMLSLSRNAMAVLAGSVIAYFCMQNYGESPFRLTGYVKSGLPVISMPPFSTQYNGTSFEFADMLKQYNSLIIFCPLIAILEHIAIAKAFSKGRTLDATQELIALGLCNMMGSFVQSMPVTGSFTRTAINNASGVKTTAAGILTGCMVLFALGFLTSFFHYIPKATLAAVIIVAMAYLCKFQAFAVLWRTKRLDLIPLLTTLGCCLFIGLEYGILIGIAVNMTFIFYSSLRPKLDIQEVQLSEKKMYYISPKTGIYYTASEYFREFILANCREEGSVVVIDGKYVGTIDTTVAKSFVVLVEELEIRGQSIIFWNFKKSIEEICLGTRKDMCIHFKSGSNLGELAVPFISKSIELDSV